MLSKDLLQFGLRGNWLSVEQLGFLAAGDARPAGAPARLVGELLA
jgi:hypothetical protein